MTIKINSNKSSRNGYASGSDTNACLTLGHGLGSPAAPRLSPSFGIRIAGYAPKFSYGLEPGVRSEGSQHRAPGLERRNGFVPEPESRLGRRSVFAGLHFPAPPNNYHEPYLEPTGRRLFWQMHEKNIPEEPNAGAFEDGSGECSSVTTVTGSAVEHEHE